MNVNPLLCVVAPAREREALLAHLAPAEFELTLEPQQAALVLSWDKRSGWAATLPSSGEPLGFALPASPQALRALLQLVLEGLRGRSEVARAQQLATVGRAALGLVHDLATLLTVTGAVLEGLEQRLVRSGSPSLPLEEARAGLSHLSSMTRQLTELGRSGIAKAQPRSLNAAAQEAMGLLRLQLPANVMLEVKLSSQELLVAVGQGELEQVLLNLVLNAVEAVGDQPGRVVVQTSRREGHATLTVADDGPGLSAQRFEELLRGQSVPGRGEGHGFGLQTVRDIAQRRGGRVRLVSEAVSGTRVEVDFPALP